jgi:hypothetical protein
MVNLGVNLTKLRSGKALVPGVTVRIFLEEIDQ